MWLLRKHPLPFLLGLAALAVLLSSRWLPGQVASQAAARDTTFRTLPALVLSNDKLDLTVLPLGGAMASLVLKDDPEQLNPMWDALRAAQEEGRDVRGGGSVGHFICVDGFGPVSAEEREAGLPGHGEAHTLPWTTDSASKQSGVTSLVQSVEMPVVQESFTRTIRIVDGENVVYVHGELTSLLSFDRPINWAEHATIGSPFLEPGVTVVDMSPNRAMTRPYQADSRRPSRRRLASGVEFKWPMAPLVSGELVDLRAGPTTLGSTDHTGHLMTPSGDRAWVTALHPAKRLLLGYMYNTSEFPWMQTWESYPEGRMLARGLEFGTQTFDLSRRQMISEGERFGTPLFRWLPAKSTIEATFLMFLVRTPEGFQGVDRIEIRDGALTIEDRRSGQSISLAASLADE